MGGKLCRYGWCIRPQAEDRACRENHAPAPKGHQRQLSATFNVAALEAAAEPSNNSGLVNINLASEEELMTLPGINRQTARNIVEYRRKLGGFNKAEDLALVSGVGATRLSALRQEITVGRPPRSGAVEGAGSKVSVNQANVFQLMKVKGISQSLAENVVTFRDRKGAFRQLDDLSKVKGMKPVLSAVRPFLCLEHEAEEEKMSHDFSRDLSHDLSDSISLERRSWHASSTKMTDLPVEDFISLYGPLSRRSWRGKRKQADVRRRSVLRVASWNLDGCDQHKADNPGVREVVAMTILENGWSIVAVQDLTETQALTKLCEELNTPTVPNVRRFPGFNSGCWRTAFAAQPARRLPDGRAEFLGFLYDASAGLKVTDLAELDHCRGQPQPFEDKLLLATFKMNDQPLTVVNMHLDVTKLEDLSPIMEAVDDFLPGEKDVLFAGSFSANCDHAAFEPWRKLGMRCALVADQYTDISTRNPEGSTSLDALWMGSNIQRLFTGSSDVVRDALTSPWIPDGWGWGGVVSSHCPVWAEFNAPALPVGQLSNGIIKMAVPVLA